MSIAKEPPMETAWIVFHPFFTVTPQRLRDAGLPGEQALCCWEGEGGRLDSIALRSGVAGVRPGTAGLRPSIAGLRPRPRRR